MFSDFPRFGRFWKDFLTRILTQTRQVRRSSLSSKSSGMLPLLGFFLNLTLLVDIGRLHP